MTSVFPQERSFPLCFGCGQFPICWQRQCLTYPAPLPVTCLTFSVLKAPLPSSSAQDLSSKEEFRLSGTLKPRLGEFLLRLGVLFSLSGLFLSIWYVLWLWDLFSQFHITCVSPQCGDSYQRLQQEGGTCWLNSEPLVQVILLSLLCFPIC